MPLVILRHLLNVSVQLANKRGLKKNLNCSHGAKFEPLNDEIKKRYGYEIHRHKLSKHARGQDVSPYGHPLEDKPQHILHSCRVFVQVGAKYLQHFVPHSYHVGF
jgi:hypothetical protein